ncbi:hypothetical protein SCMU_27690 [Sinomonas cyclohexanicum]|uniref:Uncharacterized protein n=1 Tax=Sinomonas cyclohexanicum TaxID=322009 RepID=A0ABM7PXS2_SINCY|nr:hypothetical protein [Corynebacterium cyclohexanicum]BCT76927.1 hypothetical protein SCMU_27690 [Corynebacterium cyclohexanicum]
MRTADAGAMAPSKFEPLSKDEWPGLMTEAERAAIESMLEDARQAGYWAGYHARTVECVAEHGTVLRAIDQAAQKFYLLTAEDAHAKAVGA